MSNQDSGWSHDDRPRNGFALQRLDRLRRAIPESLEGRLQWALVALVGIEALRFVSEIIHGVFPWLLSLFDGIRTMLFWLWT